MALLILIAIIFFSWIVYLFISSSIEYKKDLELQKRREANRIELDYEYPHADINSWEKECTLEEKQNFLEKLKNFDFSKLKPLENLPFELKKNEHVFFQFKKVGADFIRGKSGAIAKTNAIHYGTVYISNKRFIFVGNKKCSFDVPLNACSTVNDNTSSYMMFLRQKDTYFYFENQKTLFEFYVYILIAHVQKKLEESIYDLEGTLNL